MKTRLALLLLVAATVLAATQLNAQTKPLPEIEALPTDTNALLLVAADTNALAESIAALQERVAGGVLAEKPDAILQETNRFLCGRHWGSVRVYFGVLVSDLESLSEKEAL